jgi:hypothetical protein
VDGSVTTVTVTSSNAGGAAAETAVVRFEEDDVAEAEAPEVDTPEGKSVKVELFKPDYGRLRRFQGLDHFPRCSDHRYSRHEHRGRGMTANATAAAVTVPTAFQVPNTLAMRSAPLEGFGTWKAVGTVTAAAVAFAVIL